LPNALYNVFEKHKNILAYFSQESQQCTRLYITNIRILLVTETIKQSFPLTARSRTTFCSM